MSNVMIAGLLAGMVFVSAGHIVGEHGVYSLPKAQRKGLLRALRAFLLVPCIVLMVTIRMALSSAPSPHTPYLALGVFAVIIAFIWVAHRSVIRKLRRMGVPSQYSRQIALARIAIYVGICVMMGSVVIALFSKSG